VDHSTGEDSNLRHQPACESTQIEAVIAVYLIAVANGLLGDINGTRKVA
jgi:hypothetical protein